MTLRRLLLAFLLSLVLGLFASSISKASSFQGRPGGLGSSSNIVLGNTYDAATDFSSAELLLRGTAISASGVENTGHGVARANTPLVAGIAAADSAPQFLYRGVSSDSPAFADAGAGTAAPRGTVLNPGLHNARPDLTGYTSWTTDPGVAYDYAMDANTPGVVMRIPYADGPGYSLVPGGSTYAESEVLAQGTANGADSFNAWEFGDKWGFNGTR